MPTKNPYKTNRNFLPNPAEAIYQEEDAQISELPHIQELWNFAIDNEDQIEGDFDLDFLKFQIFDNEFAFVKTGLVAFKIKAMKLYADISHTFKAYCEDYLHMSVWMIDRLIRASKVVLDLVQAGFEILPRNEAQCRSLMRYGEEDLVLAWQMVLDHPDHNGKPHKITAKSIAHALKPESDEPTMQKFEIPVGLYQVILNQALDAGRTVIEHLEFTFLGKTNCHSFADRLQEQKWEEDLADLVSEREYKEKLAEKI